MTQVDSPTDGGPAHKLSSVVVEDESQQQQEALAESQFSFKRLLRFIGPGLLMSIAYVDPGNLESDLQTGAKTGYVLLWLMLATTVLGFLVQLQSAKLGVATGKHLAQHCREQYSLGPRLLLWIMAEVAIIGSDIQEVIGSAIAILLLSGGAIPLWAGVLITAIDAFLLLFLERFGVHILEGLFAFLIGIMVVSFGVMFSKAQVPIDQLVRGFLVPSLPREDVPTAVALVGSLIMPHNIYLHSALVLSRRQYMTTTARKKEAVTYFGIESALSLAAAVVINMFVVSVFARGFYEREDVPEIGLQNAGEYLGETYGAATVYIWALGLLAAGQSSTMTGTYTGQFVMDGYLNLKVSPWYRITITRAVAIVPTLTMALLYRSNTQELDKLNQYLNLLQSIQLPFALTPLLLFTATPAIMGAAFVTSALTSALTWLIALMVVLINAWAVYEAAISMPELQSNALLMAGVILGVVFYLGFLAWLIVNHYYKVQKLPPAPPTVCNGWEEQDGHMQDGQGQEAEAPEEGRGEGEEDSLLAPLLPQAAPSRQRPHTSTAASPFTNGSRAAATAAVAVPGAAAASRAGTGGLPGVVASRAGSGPLPCLDENSAPLLLGMVLDVSTSTSIGKTPPSASPPRPHTPASPLHATGGAAGAAGAGPRGGQPAGSPSRPHAPGSAAPGAAASPQRPQTPASPLHRPPAQGSPSPLAGAGAGCSSELEGSNT